MLSFQGGIRVPAYTASKSGVAGITKASDYVNGYTLAVDGGWLAR